VAAVGLDPVLAGTAVNLVALVAGAVLRKARAGSGLIIPARTALRVFDCHIHVQPWEQFHPAARELMSRNRSDGERVAAALARPESLLRLMDEEGVERAALINYVAPEVIGFTEEVNDWVSRFTEGHRDRLVPVGSIHPEGRATRETRHGASSRRSVFGCSRSTRRISSSRRTPTSPETRPRARSTRPRRTRDGP
jgi:hypothetical protein